MTKKQLLAAHFRGTKSNLVVTDIWLSTIQAPSIRIRGISKVVSSPSAKRLTRARALPSRRDISVIDHDEYFAIAEITCSSLSSFSMSGTSAATDSRLPSRRAVIRCSTVERTSAVSREAHELSSVKTNRTVTSRTTPRLLPATA